MSFKILGTGSCLPKTVKTNDDLSEILDTTDEWIVKRTGIKTRYILTEETLTDISLKACEKAILNSGLKKEEIDMIICATTSGEYIMPSMASVISEGLKINVPSFDVNAACSGFIYALDVACGFLERNRVKNILLVSAEEMSKLNDWTDRSTCVLFGDAASCLVLTKGTSLLSIKLSGSGNVAPLYAFSNKGNCPYKKIKRDNNFIYMDGQEVYKFAVTSFVNDVLNLMESSCIKPEQVSYVLSHQANKRIIDTAKQKLSISPEKYITNIDKVGNTSSVSIPLLIDDLNRQNRLSDGDLIIMSSFGAGLSTGSCIIKW